MDRTGRSVIFAQREDTARDTARRNRLMRPNSGSSFLPSSRLNNQPLAGGPFRRCPLFFKVSLRTYWTAAASCPCRAKGNAKWMELTFSLLVTCVLDLSFDPSSFAVHPARRPRAWKRLAPRPRLLRICQGVEKSSRPEWQKDESGC